MHGDATNIVSSINGGMEMTDKAAPIGVGLIGFGLSGRVFHAPYVAANADLALRAVATHDPGSVREQHPGLPVVTVDALLQDPGVELVVVASPDALHAEHAIAALQAGKHVVVEKPFATRLDDARRMAETAERAGKLLAAFHNRRWDADFVTLERLVAEGRLGRVVQFESHFDRWRLAVAPVWKEGRRGGVWLDLGPHLVDQAIRLLGMPQAITADIATLRVEAPAPDWFHVVLHYPGARAILHSSKLAADNALRFVVHGTAGSWIKHGLDTQEPLIVAGAKPGDAEVGMDPRAGLYTPASGPADAVHIPNLRGDYGRFWTALVAALRGEGPNPVPPADALAVMRVLEAGLDSADRGATVSLTDDL